MDLDACGRADLLAFLRHETETRGATVVYATHIFDGLAGWPTHTAHVEDGALRAAEAAAAGGLLGTVEAWLRGERDARRARGGGALAGRELPRSGPLFSSRQMSHYVG